MSFRSMTPVEHSLLLLIILQKKRIRNFRIRFSIKSNYLFDRMILAIYNKKGTIPIAPITYHTV